MKHVRFILFIACALSIGACSKDSTPDTETPPEENNEAKEGRFIVTALPYMSYIFGTGADLLYTTNTLDSGILATTGTGIEQDGTYRNYTTTKNLFFSLLFGQGNPGAVSVYKLDAQGELNRLSNFQSETMTAFAPVADDILMIKNSWKPADEYSPWYRVSTKSLEIVAQGEINTTALAGNGEVAHFSSLKQVGDKVFAPYFSMRGGPNGGNFGTDFPDSSWIAVYNYPEMTLNKVIRDGRTGFIGAYFTDGIEVDENGDVYVIATSLATETGASATKNSTKPVAIMKIKSGTTEYDKSYFFNISDVSGGAYVFRKLYLGKGNFLLMMSDTHNTYANNAKKFAIANVYDGSFKWVTGTPAPASILAITEYSSNYAPLDGKTGYVGIIEMDVESNSLVSRIYKFDAETGTATPGLTIEGQNIIRSISWIEKD